ncbi:GatB/YqeY domain-containing protein [bacterium]|nr:GatB/YqeY domain-containing protein [bacterium]
MDLQTRLMDDQKRAMKDGDKVRISVIRMLRTDLKNATISKGEDLDESEILDILSRYARKRAEAAKEFEEGGRREMAEKELAEAEIVKTYLPAALDEEEVRVIVDEVVDGLGGVTGMKHMGAVMKEVMAKTAGRAEGGIVSALVKARLSQ